MKVICIDNKPRGLSIFEDSLVKLQEGNEYSVIAKDYDGYLLAEVKSSHPQGMYLQDRFIPLSNIDETELVNQIAETY